MRRHSGESLAYREAPDDESRRSTPWMAIALVAGIVAGAKFAESLYRESRMRARAQERSERLETWEGEGGALPDAVGTGGAGSSSPRH